MGSKKKIKVKDLAKTYGISNEEILEELHKEGIEASGASSVIPDDYVELLEEHLKEVALEKKKTKKKGKSKDSESQAESSQAELKELHLKPPFIVRQLAEAIDKKPNEVISQLLKMNILANINQTIEADKATELCEAFGYELVVERREKEEHIKHSEEVETELVVEEEQDNEEDLQERAPVVTFLGHVDHGKTSLQDKVRQTNIVTGEAGGITQHIGASTVTHHGKMVTFIDTPGHEAFTAMRARGADVTDIAILVVAADDGFMPQTIEAMNHAKAAEVPIIVAINKMDLATADPDKILRQMQENGLMSEDWGGDVAAVRVSAESGLGIDELLERILLEAELLELKANPNRFAKAIVLESQLEQGLGPTANILVQTGTLNHGDFIVSGAFYGKVKAMIDEHGKRIKKAGPSMPVKVVGLSGVPEAGSKLLVCKTEKDARKAATSRAEDDRNKSLAVSTGFSLDDLFGKIDNEKRNDLKIIIKADVKGSVEAIEDSFKKLPSDKVKVDVVMNGVGGITENDVLLAAASNAIVIGFHVRVNTGVNTLAKKENVEIRLYSIIYELIEDIIDALEGRLEPEKREKDLGEAKILQIFSVSKGPNVCGCMVEKGLVRVGAKARVYRDNELIFNGEVKSLRRFQDNVKEVKQGLECGIRLDNFLDFQENDKISIYDVELKKVTLT